MHKRTVTIIPDIVRVVATICANCSRAGNKVRPSNLIVGHTSSRKQQQSPAVLLYHGRLLLCRNRVTYELITCQRKGRQRWKFKNDHHDKWSLSSPRENEPRDFQNLESINPKSRSWLLSNKIISYLYLIMWLIGQFSIINITIGLISKRDRYAR